MKDLDISATRTTPEVITDVARGNIFISGAMFPDDVRIIFVPFYKWLDQYFKLEPRQTTLFLQLTYLSPPSYNMILDLMKKLEKRYKSGLRVKIVWLFKANDEDMEENGEEFRDFAGIPFEMRSMA